MTGRISPGAVIGGAVLGFAAVGAVAVALTAAVTVVMARRVVIPVAAREEDVRVLAVDLAAGEILLEANPESAMPGEYGFWFERESGHARLGRVLSRDDRVVRREILGVDFGRLDRARRGRMDGWFHLGPWELSRPYENVVIETPVGPAPAWHVPADVDEGRWVIQVHGRGAKRQEGLRAVVPAHREGWHTLLVSYRNDGEAPDSADRRYGLGGTEWEDVVAAVEWVLAHGGRRIVLMGWSMGGAIALQAVLRSPVVRERLVGVVLESPAVDWADILRFQGSALGLPAGVGDAVTRVLSGPYAAEFTGLAAPIELEQLDVVARADELDAPILLLHSEDDGFVPIGGSRRLAEARPDLVEFEVFHDARHTKLWNAEPERWSGLISGWLERRNTGELPDLAPEAEIVG
ncbi:alpha/beta hydrolase family protein [Agromyces sp. MMS24-JH15]|uniref:alpha/beta hydrolase family protein n=1 Tax=Agromyces sp. MMS24-JH15 TaxID=3243765 RepID=UPI003749A8C9